ncbi:MAG: metallophosphoesterase family protein, partial [Anaerolineae bacterium]
MLGELARFLADEVSGGLAPDLVVITGDLAFTGKPKEYELAETWLQKLWQILSVGPSDPLPPDRLLLVPGNQDADPERVSKGARSMQDGLLDEGSQDAIAEMLEDRDDRTSLLKRHTAYQKLYAHWLGQPQPLPWWQRAIDIGGQRLHVAGLSSAWLAGGDETEDRGHLLLGRYQLHQTVLHASAGDADWRIALMHHPWDHLALFDADEARETIHLHCDLVLRGHSCEPSASHFVPADPKRACLELSAGCVDPSAPHNAFQWIELYPGPK